MSSSAVESIFAAIARAHSVVVGVMASQQSFMQRQEASCAVITVPVLRYMQAGMLPTEVACLVHRELPCDLSAVRLNCTLPALMMQQQQQEDRVVEFGVCHALLHVRDTQQFAAACIHQAYFTYGSALRSASASSTAAGNSSFYTIYCRLRGAGGALREGQGAGVMSADDVVGLYSMQLQVW